MLNVLNTPLVFCDVETTGSVAAFSRITEIACIRYEQGVEVDRFVTLLNPEINIPYTIEMITGITTEMIKDAPFFSETADRIQEIFSGATLVAHNARFDFGFIKKEMNRVGYEFNPKMLCTVQISRRLFPKFKRHDLSSVIDRYNIVCADRHRALGDTEALVQFAKHIDLNIEKSDIEVALLKKSGLGLLPPNMNQKLINTLPNCPGVYSFFGKSGELLYVGKSIDIKKRVMSHFTNSLRDRKEKKIWEEMHDVTYLETATDLGASLLELSKIKTESPIYNRMSRRVRKMWSLEKYTNYAGYTSFQLKPFQSIKENIYGIYRTKMQAVEKLTVLAKTYKLCPMLMGIEKLGKPGSPCFSHQLGLCSGACAEKIDSDIYNMQVEIIFKEGRLRTWPYKGEKVIIKKNFKTKKYEKFIVENWILKSAEIYSGEEDEYFIEGTPLFSIEDPIFDYDMYKVLLKHILN